MNYNKILKLNDSNGVTLEDLMSNLRKKFDMDLEILGPFKFLLDEVVDLSKKINDTEIEIHHSLELMKNKQDDIGKFVVDMNSFKFNENDHKGYD